VRLLLTLVGGVCWTWVYFDAVRIGLKHRTYAMPAWALRLNFAWEILYAYLGFTGAENPSPQTLVNTVWACLDIGIVYPARGLRGLVPTPVQRGFPPAGAVPA
jgi:hypothetical protein